ncbi:hypothetical protein HPP92_007355 [Vanilla planifolia]|uniref:Uncharacterized protein n=1 Tax=Vanilla planifolia TaxID=51239 RepID=A0A835V5T4_VANPL|nr:hypothetical protein HPP92_007355 [Vanilla planifolia]
MIDSWDSINGYDELSSNKLMTGNLVHPFANLRWQPKSMYLKQESELEGLGLLHYPSNFTQLPQLESPSLPLTMPSGSLSFASEIDDDENARGCAAAEKMVTDWRALDKLVASQLSQEDDFLGSKAVRGLHAEKGSEMALLFLENGNEEDSRLDGLLGSGPVDDLEFCIFEE